MVTGDASTLPVVFEKNCPVGDDDVTVTYIVLEIFVFVPVPS